MTTEQQIAAMIAGLVPGKTVLTVNVFPWVALREDLISRVDAHCAEAVPLLRLTAYAPHAAEVTAWLSGAADLLATIVRSLPPDARRGMPGKIAKVVIAVDDHAAALALAERRALHKLEPLKVGGPRWAVADD